MFGEPNWLGCILRRAVVLAWLGSVLLSRPAWAQETYNYTPPVSFNGYMIVLGFINIRVPSGYSLVSAQLLGGSITTSSIPNLVLDVFSLTTNNGSAVTKIRSDGRLGSSYFTPGVGWTETNMTLLPGEGAVLWNAGTTFTNTIVGGVLQGTLTNELPAGLTLCSSSIPQEGLLTTDLNFPATSGDVVFLLNADGSYRQYDYGVTGWTPQEPVVRVCEAFWSWKAAPTNWVRYFSPSDFLGLVGGYRIRVFPVGSEITTNTLHRAIPYLPALPGRVFAGSARALELRAISVNAAGAAYQWRKNGVALSDGLRVTGAQSDTLLLTGLQIGADDGTYTVVATNAAGRVVAHAANLQVVPAATEAPVFDPPRRTPAAVEHSLRVQSGRFYRVQASSDLRSWTEVTNFTSASSVFTLSLPADANGQRLFYRAASP